MNIALIQGNIVFEPELRESAKGRPYCRTRIAADRPYRGPDKPKEADFFTVLFFSKLAQRLYNGASKGSLITVLGRLKTEQYIDKQGNKRETTYIIADKLTIHEYKRRDKALRALDSGVDAELLVPREISESIFKQIDFTDVDLPDEGSINDLV